MSTKTQINGTTTNMYGSLVGDVVVTVTDPETSAVLGKTTSNDSGQFQVTFEDPGIYQVEAAYKDNDPMNANVESTTYPSSSSTSSNGKDSISTSIGFTATEET